VNPRDLTYYKSSDEAFCGQPPAALVLLPRCFKVPLTKPLSACIPHHVGPEDELNDTAPDIFPPIAQAHVNENGSTLPLRTFARLWYHQAWSTTRNRARVGRWGVKREALQHLAHHRFHGDRCQSLGRTRPVCHNSERNVVRFRHW